jgi:uncharacterized surface protein with fasciclin (FAS1) repeats
METTAVMQELPERLKQGDVPWLQEQLEQGNLDELRPLVGDEKWEQLSAAIRAGDIKAVRKLLRGVEVPGVGPLVPPSRTWLWVVLAVLGVAVIALVIWLLVGDDGEDDDGGDDLETITATLAADPQYSTLSELLTAAGLDEQLDGEGPFTVFAPSDDAFAALPAEDLAAIEDAPELLEEVLAYQIVAGSYPVEDLPDGELATEQGEPLIIGRDGDTVTVNDGSIDDPDIEASNGVIQGVDAVPIPPSVDLRAAEVSQDNIVNVLAADPNYSTLSALIAQSGLATVLADTGPYTLFAPDNAAFAALPPEDTANLESNNALLRQVLAYHGVVGRFPTDALEPGQLNTAEGQPVTITVAGPTIEVNTATIVQPDIEASNGVIQGINQVLVPPGVTLAPEPPTTTTEPPPATSTTAGPDTTTSIVTTTTTDTDETPNLYDALADDPHFDLFIELVDAAGLESTLADADEITVFAATDGAFGGDPDDAADLVDRIIQEMSTDELADLLLYQAVPDLYPVDQLSPGELETFLDGETITVAGTGEDATIEGAANDKPAAIYVPDIIASNGVAQGILEFLLPTGISVPD